MCGCGDMQMCGLIIGLGRFRFDVDHLIYNKLISSHVINLNKKSAHLHIPTFAHNYKRIRKSSRTCPLLKNTNPIQNRSMVTATLGLALISVQACLLPLLW